MIEISLNNEPVQLDAPLSLQRALAQWDYREQALAVAVNGEFVPRSHYPHTCLQDGDQLDIVAPVGGG